MTLTHFSHNDWADSATQVPARHHGLTPFGKEVVREMNRLGMLVDIAHTSPETMAQALDVSEAPVIFSHADARGVTNHPRNVPDDILRELARNGGVLMVSFIPDFVDERVARVTGPLLMEYGSRARQAKTPEQADQLRQEIFGHADIPITNVAAVADHIDYVRRVAGVDHVGIGSDFTAPASAGGIDMPQGLEDVSRFPNLFAELIRRGWSDQDLRKLAGENLLRVMEQVEKTAARLQKSRPASTLKYSPVANRSGETE
jgi:membrane dipeptidase